MCAKAFDDRIGVAAVLAILDELKDEDLDVDIVGTLSTQEEVGLRGANVTASRVNPDVAIVFEGTPADDVYLNQFETQAGLKKGPQVRHRDASMITHPRFLSYARGIAKQEGIMFQDAVRTGGGTDAGSIHVNNVGVPSIVIGIPARYIHTHHSFCSYDDFELSVKWGCEIVRKLNQQVINNILEVNNG
jgi:putative aminopeptidase FrvX